MPPAPPVTPPPDPIRALQRAAIAAARHLGGRTAVRVVVFLAENAKPLDVPVPDSVSDSDLVPALEVAVVTMAVPPAPKAGWSFEGSEVSYDGRRVAVATSRHKLLRVLVDAAGPLLAKEIRDLAYDRQTTEGNVRYHVDELRKELRVAFPSFEGELIVNDNGYRLEITR